MNDLFKALDMLQKGVQQYATTKVLNDANEQVAQLRDAAVDEGQKMQATRALASELTRKLTGLGMAGSQVEAVTGSMLPGQGKPIQSAIQGLTTGYDPNTPEGAEKIRQATKDYMAQVSGEKIAQVQAKAGADMGQKQFKAYDKFVSDFAKNPANKPLFDAYNTGELSPDNFENVAEYSNKLRSKLKQAGESRPTDRDLESANIDPSLWGQLKNTWSQAVSGKIPKERADLLTAMDKVASYKVAAKLNERVGAYSRFAAEYGQDPNKAQEDILNRHLGGEAFKQRLVPPTKKVVGTQIVPNQTGSAGFFNQGAAPAADWKKYVK